MPASPSTAYARSSYRPSLGLPSLPLRSEGAAARLGFYESLRLGTHLPGSSTPGSRFSVSDHGDSLRLSGVLAGFDPTGQKDNVTAEKHNLGWKLLKPFHRKHGKDMHEMVSTTENPVSVQNGFASLPRRHGMEVEDRHVFDAIIRSNDVYREGDFCHEREMRNPVSVSEAPTSESQLDVIYQTPPAFPAPVDHQPGLIVPPPRQRPRIPEAFRLNLEQRSWPDVEASQLGTLEKGKSRSSPSMSSGYIADNGPFSCNGSPSSPNLVMDMRHPWSQEDTGLSRTQPALGVRTGGQRNHNSTSPHDVMKDWMSLDGTGEGMTGTSLVADVDSRFDEPDLESTTKEAYLDQYIARFYENRRYGQCDPEGQL